MCSYCPVLASGKRGPAAEGMLTVQIGTPNLTLHTHPRGEPLARGAKPARPIDHGFYAEMGDYVVQALRPAGDIDGGQNPAFDAAFLYPGQVLPPHLTRRRHAQPQRYSYEEEEDEWDALLSWFGLGESHDGGVATERDALPAPKRAGFPPIPNPVESTSYPVTHRPVTHPPERRDSADASPPAVRPDPTRRRRPGWTRSRAYPRRTRGPAARTRGWSTSHRPRTTTCVRRSAIGRVGRRRLGRVVTHRAVTRRAASSGGRTGPGTTPAEVAEATTTGFDPGTSTDPGSVQ